MDMNCLGGGGGVKYPVEPNVFLVLMQVWFAKRFDK